jgi:hypothetical protein
MFSHQPDLWPKRATRIKYSRSYKVATRLKKRHHLNVVMTNAVQSLRTGKNRYFVVTVGYEVYKDKEFRKEGVKKGVEKP